MVSKDNYGIFLVKTDHRRRIYTEEKTKVVAAAWGTEASATRN